VAAAKIQSFAAAAPLYFRFEILQWLCCQSLSVEFFPHPRSLFSSRVWLGILCRNKVTAVRLFLFGPRLLHGLVQPGISLGPEDFPDVNGGAAPAPGRPLPKDTFLYAIKGNANRCKIGFTDNPNATIALLRKVSASALDFAWIGVPQGDGALIEQDAKAALAQSSANGNPAANSEWFNTTPEAAVGAIWTAAQRRGRSIPGVTPQQAEQIRLATLREGGSGSPGTGVLARLVMASFK
jgi:hypothetical protein